MTTKIWQYFKQEKTQDTVIELQKSLGVSQLIAKLLNYRGIYSFDEAKKYFRPSLEDLHDPMLMKNMLEASSVLIEAIKSQKKILVYGDYDVDGTCSVTILYQFLLAQNASVAFYIPNRYSEGYGVSDQGIDFTIDNDFELLITVDCGIKAITKLNRAKEAGIEVIVCDHHLPGKELPSAIVLNPKQENCQYPWKELCGAGIVFKLITSCAKLLKLPEDHYLQYLDFGALATAADMVELKGENRILVYHGLQKINSHPHPGISRLMKVALCNSTIKMRDIAFTIAPRINAAGRIGEASRIVELFTSGDPKIEQLLSEEISTDNEIRRSLDQEATLHALELLALEENKQSNVVYHESWNKGIIGIVASRILEKRYKPTIVLTQSNGLLTGSARSVIGFNIHDAIENCAHLLENFGGHSAAAGLTIKLENLNAFKEQFERECAAAQPTEKPILQIEADINLSDLDSKFFRILNQFEPMGIGNPEPIFSLSNFDIVGEIKVLGENHLKFNLQQDKKGPLYEAIAFKSVQYLKKLQQGKVKSLAFSPELNEWNGKTTVQLNIKDFDCE